MSYMVIARIPGKQHGQDGEYVFYENLGRETLNEWLTADGAALKIPTRIPEFQILGDDVNLHYEGLPKASCVIYEACRRVPVERKGFEIR